MFRDHSLFIEKKNNEVALISKLNMQLFIYIHILLFYLRRKKTLLFKYTNSSNVTGCEARKNHTYIHIWESYRSDYLDMEDQPTYLFLHQKVSKEGMVLWSGYFLDPIFDVVLILTVLHHAMQIPFS